MKSSFPPHPPYLHSHLPRTEPRAGRAPRIRRLSRSRQERLAPPPRAWSPSVLMPAAPAQGTAPFFTDNREPRATSPASSDTASTCTLAAPDGRVTTPERPRIETDARMSGPNSPELEERTSPDAPRWEDTQTRDARYLLAQARALCSQRQPIPFELDLQAISNHTGDLALEITAGLARDFNPKRLRFGNYVQRYGHC